MKLGHEKMKSLVYSVKKLELRMSWSIIIVRYKQNSDKVRFKI